MRKFGLIGYPLSHSFSKKYFAEKFEREGIQECVYELYPIQDILELPGLIAKENLEGINVTIPYKKVILPFLTSLSNEVSAINACNCVAINEDKIIGYNTDIIGFRKTFEPNLKAHHSKALILGTGGASLAVAYTLQQLKIDFLFVSRNAHQHNTIAYHQIDAGIINAYSIIINTTPLGTYPEVDQFPTLPYQLLNEQHYLYDLVYNPAETLFLKKGKQQGATVQNGAEMLVIQAEESWNIWNK